MFPPLASACIFLKIFHPSILPLRESEIEANGNYTGGKSGEE